MRRLMAVKLSETGLVRDRNEDHVFFYEDTLVCGVADGMGGGSEGERASEMVMDALRGRRTADEIADALAGANSGILDYSWTMGYENMGSTVALVAFDDDCRSATVCHIGDSRVYLVRGAEARQLTRDHSVCAEVGMDVNTPEGRRNPLAHMLTRVIGVMSSVTADWRKLEVRRGDRFLVCSDGVHDVLSAADIGSLIAGTSIKAAAARIADLVVERGAPDNYSLVLVEVA